MIYFHIACIYACLNCIALATYDEESIYHVELEWNGDDVSWKDEGYAAEESAENTTDRLHFMYHVVSEPCIDELLVVSQKDKDYAANKRIQLEAKNHEEIERQFKTLKLEGSKIEKLELDRSQIGTLEFTSELESSKTKLLDEEIIKSK